MTDTMIDTMAQEFFSYYRRGYGDCIVLMETEAARLHAIPPPEFGDVAEWNATWKLANGLEAAAQWMRTNVGGKIMTVPLDAQAAERERIAASIRAGRLIDADALP